MEKSIDQLLKKSRLSITESRVKILELFFSQPDALAHGDIEKKTGEKFDRVTVYRTLQVFLAKGIIHTIPTNDNSIRYALCREACEEGHHHDNHVHFVCNDCGSTTCLEEITIPAIKLPKGYASSQVEMIVSGICRKCKK